ncbi:dockerin type I domain-containing protein [Stieleria sp. TO1_6]|uniref:ELWxxDGT repeat protein n=1 Tax=Stieleria tagensis TaxID=2956795 RepID=UPI00209B784B|nr:ELWxxDGT repeat protein [Stieleria tagensis]MCO8123765.1 dockerin type I domain-containing protein [Stieleria tagensis]
MRRRRLGAAIETLEQRNLLTYAIDLFADINQLGISSDINQVVPIGNETFFVADDGQVGSELWKTDGTAGGTVLVKDLLPGPDTSSPSDLTAVGGLLYFTALDENSETDLWKSDGTEAGTVKVFDADAAGVYYLSQLTESGGKLFFTAYEPSTSYELWVSDGTSSGTQLVLDINSDQTVFERPQELTDVNGTLFFSSYDDGYYNRELWKSDGTAAGTMMVADLGIDPGADPLDPADDDPSVSSNPSSLTNVGGQLFFTAEDYVGGVELFRSDGTAAGTVMVADFNPSGSSDPRELTAFDGDLFFSADDGTSGRHLYRSDGNSISFVADTTGGLGESVPVDFAVVGNELFFSANGSASVTTVSATVPTLTADNSVVSGGDAGLVAQTTSASAGVISSFTGIDTFNAVQQGGVDDGPGWVSSGARPGTAGVGLQSVEVGDLYVNAIGPGELATEAWEWTISDPAGLSNISFAGFASGNEFNSYEEPISAFDEGLLFELFLNGSSTPVMTDTVTGDALNNWYAGRDAANVNLSDAGGAAVTTATVRLSIGNSTFPNYPSGGDEAFIVNATLTADLDSNTTHVVDTGRELHKTDGTTAGTVMVKDIVPQGSSNPFQLTAVGNQLFFSADDVLGDGLELWVSDGTESGTVQVIDSLPGNDLYGAPLDGAPELFGVLGGELLFTTTDSTQDRELWISDGTAGGTAPVMNINPTNGDADISDVFAFGNSLYYVANDGLNGEAIWHTDTLTGVTEMLVDVSPSSTDKISKLGVINDSSQQIVFYNNSLGTQGGVYFTDRSGSLTQLTDRRPVPLDADGTMFVMVGHTIYFVADDGPSGNELWRSDGTAAGTRMVEDLIPGTDSSDPRELTSFMGRLYFSADSEDYGRELFSTDGNTITLEEDLNTRVVNGTNQSSDPEELTVSGGKLFFTADDDVIGRELYRRDSVGIDLVADIRSGGNSSDPLALRDVDGVLYFAAHDGSDGFEPFRSTGTDISTYQIADINSGGSGSFPNQFFEALGQVFFSADDGTTGRELWVTDGTAGNATQVADIQPGGASEPVPLLDTGKRLLLSAAGSGFDDRELWATDGTSANTLQVEDLYPTEFFGSDPTDLIQVYDRMYFVATSPTAGRELFQIEEVSPQVATVSVGGEVGQPPNPESQRSTVDLVTVVLDGRIDVPASAISLVNRDTGQAVNSVQVNSRFESGQTLVELTFASGASVINRDPHGTTGLRHSLADGNYQLTIAGASVSSLVSGAVMAADYQFGTTPNDQFFRFFGDVDGDRDVDGLDYSQFAQTFLQSLGSADYNEEFDFDGDGDVDSLDFGQLSQHFRRKLNF